MRRGVIVTGSSSGIGRAIALRLGRDGVFVLCCDVVRDGAPGTTATDAEIRAAGGDAAYEPCDVRDEASVTAAFAALDTAGVVLAGCVLNAGVFERDASILDETVEEHDRTLRVNERGVWLGLRCAARQMVTAGRGGRIVCTASVAGLVGLADEPSYCASKGAVVSLVRATALDLAGHGITVNAVCPGFIDTPMLARTLAEGDARSRLEAQTPLQRLGRPEDVAGAVAFLLSDDAAWITGITLPVDGGYTCR